MGVPVCVEAASDGPESNGASGLQPNKAGPCQPPLLIENHSQPIGARINFKSLEVQSTS